MTKHHYQDKLSHKGWSKSMENESVKTSTLYLIPFKIGSFSMYTHSTVPSNTVSIWLRKIVENCQDRKCPSLNSNWAPPEYKSWVLLLQQPAAQSLQWLSSNISSMRINDVHSSVDFRTERWHENLVSVFNNMPWNTDETTLL
jgi:hypothetical protein